jgi:hypothetical protein
MLFDLFKTDIKLSSSSITEKHKYSKDPDYDEKQAARVGVGGTRNEKDESSNKYCYSSTRC